MKRARLFALLLALPLATFAADRYLKIDPTASFVEVDVDVTVGDFTARLDKYDLRVIAEDKKGVKSSVLNFKFADLKTGELERDQKMLEWLGGNDAAGKFESGIVALTPDGQGRVNGRLTFHGKTDTLEFPVNVTKAGNVFTLTGEAVVDYRHFDLKTIRKAGLIKVDPYVKVRFKFTGTPGDVVPPAVPGPK